MTAIVGRELLASGFSSLWRLRLRAPGGAEYERQLEDHGNAAAVLPYDPVRRVALVITQPRPPVILAGAPPLIEAVAGLIEHGDAADTARAEAMEEAGVRLGPLELVVDAWTMCALSTERVAMFLAPYAAADRIAAGGGLAEEHEDIAVHEMPLAELRALRIAGRLTDIKALLLVQALELRAPELFVGAATG